MLLRARLEQRLDVAALAARTKINAKYLEAIEADDRSGFPSNFFYKSFVLQYARTLSLDTKEIEVELDRVLSADAPPLLPGQENPTSPEVSPISTGNRRTGFPRMRTYLSFAGLIVVLAACTGIYAWWRPAHSTAAFSFEPSAPVVKAAAVPVSVASAEAATQPQPPQAIPQQPPAKPEVRVLVDLTAHQPTWLSVSSDGKPVFSGILAANESKTVEGKESAKIRVGNAAGLEVRLNGKPLGPLGHKGQVLTVVFTPGNFQITSSAKESD
jgi:cytoskeletal protein RodZ